jgi:hypothetical protein
MEGDAVRRKWLERSRKPSWVSCGRGLIKCSREFFWTLTGNLLSGNVAAAYRLVEAEEAAFWSKSGVARHAPRQ